jgi:hypothetical protein
MCIESYALRFKTLRTKCTIDITEQKCIKLILEGMQWKIKRRFIETKH